jgi:hypothetical protein
MTVHFEPGLHRYTDADGNILPSVTQLIGRWWPVDWGGVNVSVLARAAQRGTDVHEWTAMCDSGLITADLIGDEELQPYVDAWQKYVSLTGPVFTMIEASLGHSRWKYAGTVDRVAQLGGKTVVIDLKIGSKQSWHAVQTAAYSVLLEDEGVKVDAAFTVLLKESGKFAVEEHDLKRARDAWLCYLRSEQYRRAQKGMEWAA